MIVAEVVCARTAEGCTGTAGDVTDDERGPVPEDAICADAEIADAVARVDAGVMREALARALGLDGAAGHCGGCGRPRERCTCAAARS